LVKRATIRPAELTCRGLKSGKLEVEGSKVEGKKSDKL
jgi:hypothetical protein